MICMFQQYQVDCEDAQVFMCKFSLVLTNWRAVGQHIILEAVIYKLVARKFGVKGKTQACRWCYCGTA